mmetsp:Transcript_1869/g.2870  ORF Transcript_1869/g.2870 Transcript_1869/m.2870 type:complete len:186 (-) Transcript_1869:223-780(-)
MSGLGRRSHYRKHLTDSVLNDFPEPGENELIVKVLATRGSNQFDICTPSMLSEPQLAILPTKFHKLVWIKRNDFVIVQHGGGRDEDGGGIRFIINHILYKEQIKHLQSKKLWPKEFDDVNQDNHSEDQTYDNESDASDNENQESNDGIVYDHGYERYDDMLMVNTNKVAALRVDDDSSSSSEDED